jgi:hypothetical protein
MTDTQKLEALADGLDNESDRAQNEATDCLAALIQRAQTVRADVLVGILPSNGALASLVTLAREVEKEGRTMARAAEGAATIRDALKG